MKELPASCTVGDWLRRVEKDGRGLSGLGNVNEHVVAGVGPSCKASYSTQTLTAITLSPPIEKSRLRK